MSDPIPSACGPLEESPGVKSSKRYAGAALIAAGCLLLVAVGVVALFKPIADGASALAAGQALVWSGAALLGATVLEGAGRRIGGQ